MKKILFLFTFLILCSAVFAQVTDMEKDTIHIEEIVLKNKKTSKKILKLRGQCYYPEDMRNAEEIITLVEKLPKGYIESVSFYFNEASSYSEPGKFKDTEFELVFYTVDKDNNPGDRIIHDTKTIRINKESKGRIEINLFELNIENPERLFVGLKRTAGASLKREFLIDCLCNGLDKYVTLTRNNSASDWERRWECAAMKVDMAIVVAK